MWSKRENYVKRYLRQCKENKKTTLKEIWCNVKQRRKLCDIIWTEHGDVIDTFIPLILIFKECSKRVKHGLDTLWTLQYLRKEVINQINLIKKIWNKILFSNWYHVDRNIYNKKLLFFTALTKAQPLGNILADIILSFFMQNILY